MIKYNINCIYTWVDLQLYEYLYDHDNYGIYKNKSTITRVYLQL